MRNPELSRVIARELRSDVNRRYLARMPLFSADQGLPDTLRSLLERLREAERGSIGTRH